MALRRITRTQPAGEPGAPTTERPVLIVAYDQGTDRYYLAEQESGRRVAGPFRTALLALEFARSSISLGR